MDLLGGNNLTKYSVEKMNFNVFFFLEMNINAFCSFASNKEDNHFVIPIYGIHCTKKSMMDIFQFP
jgi:hypothetical protein